MSSSEREQLKPCPWCNGMEMLASSNGYESHMVVCNGCGAEGPAAISAAEAFTAWNRRAQASAEPVAWEVRRIDPEEGPSIWLPANSADLDAFRQRPHLWELRPLYAAPQQAPLPEALHTFLDAAAGDGLVIGGVDAADLYIELFPERYAAATAKLDAGTTDGITATKEST